MEGKRWRVIWGERISGGKGVARRVGRASWSVRRVLPSLRVRGSGWGVGEEEEEEEEEGICSLDDVGGEPVNGD